MAIKLSMRWDYATKLGAEQQLINSKLCAVQVAELFDAFLHNDS